MKDVAAMVAGIEYKVGRLMEKHYLLRDGYNRQAEEIGALKEVVREQKQKIDELESKIKTLKITKSLESNEGNVEAKLKINELVREIDKCIGLLNT